MDSINPNELARLQELLQRSSEFIAYFELTEEKMLAWREMMSQEQQRLKDHQAQLQNQYQSIQELLSATGIHQFRQQTQQALDQGQEHRQLLVQTGKKILQQMAEQQGRFDKITAAHLEAIDQHSNTLMAKIDNQLAKYDVQQFHRIATESCDQVEQAAQDAVAKSSRLLKMFQWRFSLLTAVTTLVTAFILGLYLSSELPWEMHQTAVNERQAGKVLLQAWPHMSHEDRIKILHYETPAKG